MPRCVKRPQRQARPTCCSLGRAIGGCTVVCGTVKSATFCDVLCDVLCNVLFVVVQFQPGLDARQNPLPRLTALLVYLHR